MEIPTSPSPEPPVVLFPVLRRRNTAASSDSPPQQRSQRKDEALLLGRSTSSLCATCVSSRAPKTKKERIKCRETRGRSVGRSRETTTHWTPRVRADSGSSVSRATRPRRATRAVGGRRGGRRRGLPWTRSVRRASGTRRRRRLRREVSRLCRGAPSWFG